MKPRPQARRLLLVHAHPDDESIETGATMAKYSAEGAQVTLVTCTLGELGEIIPPELAFLAASHEDRLGEERARELAAACAALGVSDYRFLGGAGRWRDSGMMGLASNGSPRCFWQADLDTAAAELAVIIRDVRPQVIVTYDANGFYGHPDHIQAHRVTRRAIELAANTSVDLPKADCMRSDTADCPRTGILWQVEKFYATAIPRSVLAQVVKLPTGVGCSAGRFVEVSSIEDLPFGVPDNQVTTHIDGTSYLTAKIAAMRAHITQIAVDNGSFALSNMIGQRVTGHEFYTLLAGPREPSAEPHDLENDLFEGIILEGRFR